MNYATSGPTDFDNVTVNSSSRPATGGQNLTKAGVRKVQSSAFVNSSAIPKDAKLQANKLRINQNSGQLHAPKLANQGGGMVGSGQHSFHLSKEAYQKLTNNYNYSNHVAAAQRNKNHNMVAYATQDLRP